MLWNRFNRKIDIILQWISQTNTGSRGFLLTLIIITLCKPLKKVPPKFQRSSLRYYLTFSMIIPPTINAQEAEDGDRVLRKGHCWLDNEPNCRKKRGDDPTCEGEQKHCSGLAYLKAGALIAGVFLGSKDK